MSHRETHFHPISGDIHGEVMARKLTAGQSKIPIVENPLLGGGFKHVLFSPLFGEDSHFD